MAGLGGEIKVRVSVETKIELARIAEEAGEGVKISDVVRDAIGEFLKVRRKGKPKKAAQTVAEPEA